MKRFDFLSKLSSLVFIAVVSCGFSPSAPAQKQGPQADSAIADGQAKLVLQLGHSDDINSVEYSPDGKYVLTGSSDKTVRLWEVETGREVRRFDGHSSSVRSVAFSPDGKYVLTGSSDKTARLWEVENGKEVRQFKGHPGLIRSVAFSPDGKYVLAGREVSAAKKKRVPNADKLRPCRPEDLVLISFSCHGYADGDGNFFLVMYDTGTNKGINDQLLNRSISSEELSLWLRDVDAGEMMMIVDACHSAAAVEGTEFKPGPMGSRGLGQLSYDKGMKILTATQIEEAALGAETLKQGLLTYALVVDGLNLGKADFKPLDKTITASEWLQYAEYRVPRLYDEILKDGAASDIRDLLRKQVTEIRRQQPSLFDFSRKQRDALIVR